MPSLPRYRPNFQSDEPFTVNEPNRQAEIDRGAEAQAIFNTPVFIEAREYIESQLRTLRSQVPIRDTEMHTRLILMEQLWHMLLSHLEGAMSNAEFARAQMQQRENAFTRMKSAMEVGLRNIF